MIVTCTPNPALDVTVALDHLERGRVHRAHGSARRAGGKGVNVARVLTEQGIAATAVVVLGGSIGAAVREDLDRSGIAAAAVDSPGTTRMTIALIDRETTNVNEPGVDPGDKVWGRIAAEVERLLQPGDVLVLSGSLPAGAASEAASEAAFEPLRIAARLGIPSIADVPGTLLPAAIAAGATYVKPNRAELAEATGISDPLEAARSLVSPTTNVLASLDAEGLMLVTTERAVAAHLAHPLEGNTTGAGDAAVAALAAALADGTTDLAEIARRCVLWSAAAVLHPLAGSITDPGALAALVRIRDLEA